MTVQHLQRRLHHGPSSIGTESVESFTLLAFFSVKCLMYRWEDEYNKRKLRGGARSVCKCTTLAEEEGKLNHCLLYECYEARHSQYPLREYEKKPKKQKYIKKLLHNQILQTDLTTTAFSPMPHSTPLFSLYE